MKNVLRFMIGALIAVSFVACSDPTKADKELKDLREKIADDQRKHQENLDKIKNSGEELAKTLDWLNKGGQPPSVRLEGALIVDGKLHSQIDLKIMAGFNKNGEPTPIEPTRASFEGNEVFDDSPIKSMVDKGTYVNMGCELSGRKDIESLTEVEITQTPGAPIQASVAFICGGNVSSDLKFVVGKVIFDEAKINISNATVFGVNIKANEIVLIGSSHILAKAEYLGMGETFISVTIGTNKVSGDGTLEIKSEGADYKVPEKLVTEK